MRLDQLSPRPARRSVSVEIMKCVRITQTDRVSASGALSATAIAYSLFGYTYIVVYTHPCNRRLNYYRASTHVLHVTLSEPYVW